MVVLIPVYNYILLESVGMAEELFTLKTAPIGFFKFQYEGDAQTSKAFNDRVRVMGHPDKPESWIVDVRYGCPAEKNKPFMQTSIYPNGKVYWECSDALTNVQLRFWRKLADTNSWDYTYWNSKPDFKENGITVCLSADKDTLRITEDNSGTTINFGMDRSYVDFTLIRSSFDSLNQRAGQLLRQITLA